MSDVRRDIYRRYWQQNRLQALVLELTHRCPCRCRHCYIVRNPQDDGLDTDAVRAILDQACDEGVFQILLTGGEVLLRPDLDAILAHARSHKFFVTVLTSGLTLDVAAADMLARHKIYNVEMSLLGATAEVNDDMMQVPGALERIRRAAKLLRARGLRVVLKATILRTNRHQIDAMKTLAQELDCSFNTSTMVSPCRDRSTDPLDLALTEDELADLDPALISGAAVPGETAGGGVLVCSAGRTGAGVSPQGDVYPCIMWPRPVGNLRERSLHDIWHAHPDPFLESLRALEDADIRACVDCDLRPHCTRCPGIAWQETGELAGPAPSLCSGARGRARAVQRFTAPRTA